MRKMMFVVEIFPKENLIYIGSENGSGYKYTYNSNDTEKKQVKKIEKIIGEYLENYCGKVEFEDE